MADYSPRDQRYNDILLALEDFSEFHPEFGAALTEQERTTLLTYFPLNNDGPDNIIEFRDEAISQDKDLENQTQQVLWKYANSHGIEHEDFTLT